MYPDYRLGETGDAPKAYCSTCHQGQNKPLGGANMVNDYLPGMAGKDYEE
ncbi:MAG: photosynthetic reaction center cytochrome c subunit family protein [Pseudomonadota bacterium]